MARNTPDKVPAPWNRGSNLSRAYRLGWNHGHGLACHNKPTLGDRIDLCVDWVGCGDVVDAENIKEYHELLCFAAEEHSRCYSPFEFTAQELNSARNSDRLWEAFEAGIADSIRADLAEYTDEDYGMEPEAAEAEPTQGDFRCRTTMYQT